VIIFLKVILSERKNKRQKINNKSVKERKEKMAKKGKYNVLIKYSVEKSGLVLGINILKVILVRSQS